MKMWIISILLLSILIVPINCFRIYGINWISNPDEVRNGIVYCQYDVIHTIYQKIDLRTASFQPLYFCANVPNGWWSWDKIVSKREKDTNKIEAKNRNYFSPGREHWLQDPNFKIWGYRERDPYSFRDDWDDWPDDDFYKTTLSKVEPFKGAFNAKSVRESNLQKVFDINAKQRENVEDFGFYFKVDVTGIGITQPNKEWSPSRDKILMGWYHLKITLAVENYSALKKNPDDYVINRLMVSGRGVRVHRVMDTNEILMKGVSGGVGEFVHDFPQCQYYQREPDGRIKPGSRPIVPDMKFLKEQVQPCGGQNTVSSYV